MRPNGTLLVDTGFWFAFYDGREEQHPFALSKSDVINKARLIVPWPILYETFNTRFIKNPMNVNRFDLLLKKPETVLIDDVSYRNEALHATIRESQNRLRAISLVDMVIRFILDDPNIRIEALLTINQSDFDDICRKRRIEML
jgi:predicted nucleic acid-binding protein